MADVKFTKVMALDEALTWEGLSPKAREVLEKMRVQTDAKNHASKGESKAHKEAVATLAPQALAFLRSIAPEGATATEVGQKAFEPTLTSQKVGPVLRDILCVEGTVRREEQKGGKVLYFAVVD